MKRDLELIRKILFKIEDATDRDLTICDLSSDPQEFSIISFHIELLLDAKFIVAKRLRFIGKAYPDFYIQRLTNDGCDYLDSIRDNKVWTKTKEKLKAVGGTMSFEVVKDLALSLAKLHLGL